MIVTFYSFKGGVGRSMAMAAVGYLLAQRGLRVLVIDFDLEAPGLERYFFDEPGVLATVRGNPGLMNLVLDYKRALTSAAEFERAEFKQWRDYVTDAIPQTPSGGFVDLMTSGRRHPQERYAEYALFVRSFDWQDFFQNWRGGRFFDWLRRELTTGPDGYDIVLVDSRTGVTEMGGVCAYQLADAAVLFCAPNYQNIDGTRAVLDDFRSDAVTALRQGRALELVVVPARVEQGESATKRDQFFTDFERVFGSEGLPRILAEVGLDYRRLCIPYERELAIIERLVGDTSAGSGALSADSPARASFEVLADAITLLGREEGRWARLRQEASDRLRGGQATPESLPLADLTKRGAGYDVFVEYGSGDSVEAQRLCEALTGRGLTIWTPEAVRPGEEWGTLIQRALQYSQAVLFCVGQSAPTPSYWNTLRTAQERRKRIVPVLLPGGRSGEDLTRSGLEGFRFFDLRGGVDDPAELDSLTEAIGVRGGPEEASQPMAARNPYPGVSPFSEDDSAFFCGREQDVIPVMEALATHDVVLLSGPSCAGKTSLVHAALLPRCRAGGLEGSTAGEGALTPIVVDCASERAAADLERAATLPPDAPALIVLDNIDTFPRGGGPEAQIGRVNEVAALLDGAGRRTFLLVWRGVWPRERRDAAIAAWSRRGAPHECALEPLSSENLRQAMEQPAARSGHLFEPGLVDRVLQDAGAQPGAVAQVQLVLADLWGARRRGWLTNKAYDAKKGIAGRFTERLAALLEAESAENREAVESMLRAMVQFDAQLSCSPRPQPWETLASIPRVRRVDAMALRDRMVAARVIDLWPAKDGGVLCGLAQPVAGSLVDRIARAEPEFLLWRQRFDSYVAGYRQAGRPAGYTVAAEVLGEAEGWWNSHRDDLSSDEQAVIESSARVLRLREADERQRDLDRLETARIVEERDRANAERARAERERTRAEALTRRSRFLMWVTTTLLVLVTVFAFMVWRSRMAETARLNDERALLANERVQEAAARLDKGQPAEALAFVADALQLDGANESARSLALDLILNGRWPRDVVPVNRAVLDLAWSADSRDLLFATARDAQVRGASGRDATPLRFGGEAEQVEWSPDGRHVATRSSDGTVQLYDAGSGQPAAKALAHDTPIVFIAWKPPDGRAIATASDNGDLRLWTLSGAEIARRGAGGAPVTAVAWSPAGDRLAVGRDDGGVGVWDPGQRVRRPGTSAGPLLQFAVPVAALGWSADGERVVAVDRVGTAAMRDLASRAPPEQWPLANGPVTLAAWHARTGTFAIGFRNGSVATWQPGSGAKPPVLIRLPPDPPQGSPVRELAWSPSGAVLAVATDRFVELLNPDTGQPVGESLLHDTPVTAVAWSGDGRALATADRETARVWDAGLTRPAGLLLSHTDRVAAAEWNPSGTLVATASWDGRARLWRTDTGELVRDLVHEKSVLDVSWSSDGTRVATASSDGTAVIWSSSGDRSKILRHPSERAGTPIGVSAVEWSPAGNRLATVAEDNRVRIWRTDSGELERGPLEHKSSVVAVAWSPDGQQLATGANDGQLHVWNVLGTGPAFRDLTQAGPVTGLAWSPQVRGNGDRRRLLAAWSNLQPAASVWNVMSMSKEPEERLPLSGLVQALAWSPVDERLATGSADGTAQVWSTVDWQPLGDPLRHAGVVTSLAWSRDGHRLATGSLDSTARVWDPRSGRALGAARTHRVPVVAVQWSPDGERLLAVSSLDRAARVWDVPRGRVGAAHDLAALALAVGGLRVKPGDVAVAGTRRLPRPERLEWSWRGETMARLRKDYLGRSSAPGTIDRLMRWYFEDPYSRTFSPLSSIRVPDYAARLTSVCVGVAMEEVRVSFPAFWSPDVCRPAQGGRNVSGK